MTETINILCATDNRYAPYCGIMLTSLLENNRSSRFCIYVFVDKCLSEDNELKYQQLAQNYACEIHVMHIDESLLEKCPVNKDTNITLATYYRLLAPQLLPQNVHKLIYLDCDMIISGDIQEIWNVDIYGHAIAGVVDCEAYNDNIYKRLDNYTTNRNYYNAGMTVYNLDYWRENNIAGQAFEYIEKNQEKLYWMDQDVLNVLLDEKKILLPPRCNFQTLYYLPRNWVAYSSDYQQQILSEGQHPLIIHYNGPGKPWNFRYFGAPYYREWDEFCCKSLWPDCRINRPLVKYIKYLVKRYITKSFLKKQLHQSWHIEDLNKKYYYA